MERALALISATFLGFGSLLLLFIRSVSRPRFLVTILIVTALYFITTNQVIKLSIQPIHSPIQVEVVK